MKLKRLTSSTAGFVIVVFWWNITARRCVPFGWFTANILSRGKKRHQLKTKRELMSASVVCMLRRCQQKIELKTMPLHEIIITTTRKTIKRKWVSISDVVALNGQTVQSHCKCNNCVKRASKK